MKAYAPNGAAIRGTLEFSVSYAHVIDDSFRRRPDGDVEFEHAGDTESFYHDGQQTVMRDGETVFEDYNGDPWKESRLILVENDEELAEDDPRIDPAAEPDHAYIMDAGPMIDLLEDIHKGGIAGVSERIAKILKEIGRIR
jgi:hypothetical protein